MTEQIIRIGAKMYECRDLCRMLFGAKYTETLKPYTETIRDVAKKQKIDILSAALSIAKRMKVIDHDPMVTACVMAAAVDLIEADATRTTL